MVWWPLFRCEAHKIGLFTLFKTIFGAGCIYGLQNDQRAKWAKSHIKGHLRCSAGTRFRKEGSYHSSNLNTSPWVVKMRFGSCNIEKCPKYKDFEICCHSKKYHLRKCCFLTKWWNSTPYLTAYAINIVALILFCTHFYCYWCDKPLPILRGSTVVSEFCAKFEGITSLVMVAPAPYLFVPSLIWYN